MSSCASTTRWSGRRRAPDSTDDCRPVVPQRVVFVCTAQLGPIAAGGGVVERESARCRRHRPARIPRPGCTRGRSRAGRRHGLRLGRAETRWHRTTCCAGGDLVVAVCDNAHEELDPGRDRLHWSIPDPVRVGTDAAFDAAYDDITRRVDGLLRRHRPPPTILSRLEEPGGSMTRRRRWNTLSLDQSLALRHAATRLADEFDGVFGAETIERFLHSSFDQFADRATVVKFLPLMAERFARQRLRALAKVEGLHDDGKPTVLFLCTHNAGRSQMALGFFTAPRR